MTDGHCDHCGAACREDDAGRAHRRTASETNMAWSATWLDGRCPLCAAEARIATSLYVKLQAAGDSVPVGSGKFLAGYISGLDAAALLVVGTHLEATND